MPAACPAVRSFRPGNRERMPSGSACVFDNTADRQSSEAVAPLKSLETGNCRLHSFPVARPEGDQFGHRPVVPGDDKPLPGLDAPEQPVKVGFRFGCADFGHGAGLMLEARLDQSQAVPNICRSQAAVANSSPQCSNPAFRIFACRWPSCALPVDRPGEAKRHCNEASGHRCFALLGLQA